MTTNTTRPIIAEEIETIPADNQIFEFPTTTFYGERPDWATDLLVMVAPRPLLGETVEIEGCWLHGQVAVTPDAERTIKYNWEMDAQLVEWVTCEHAAAQYKQHCIDDLGYTQTAIDEADVPDQVWADSWMSKFGRSKITITAE